jgi:hypothetical protein
MARGDLRQLSVVAAREVVPDPTELFVHDVEVIEDPLRGGRDLVFRHRGVRDVPVAGQKHLRVVANPGEEIASLDGLFGAAMGRRQALGVLLQTLDAEQLGADRLFRPGSIGDDGGGGLQRQLLSRDIERMLPFPSPKRFGTSRSGRCPGDSCKGIS